MRNDPTGAGALMWTFLVWLVALVLVGLWVAQL